MGQGHTVFVISWVNPDQTLSGKSFDDYMKEGPLAALDAMEQATGEKEANVIGYCLGGTLLSATLAYMAAKRDRRVKSATYFVTMVDFAEAGELSVFIDEEQIHALEERMEKKGYLEARDMHTTFNMLRANDLIWSFVVNNYLLGKSPLPFDLLVLERRFDADAGGDAQLLPAQDVPGEPAGEAGRHHPRRRQDRFAQGQDAGLHPVDPRGPYRAVALDLCGDAALRRARSSSCCRPRATSPGWSTRRAANTGTGENDTNPPSPDDWLATATHYDASWWPVWEEWISQYARRRGPRPPARRRQAQADRGRAGELREGAGGGLGRPIYLDGGMPQMPLPVSHARPVQKVAPAFTIVKGLAVMMPRSVPRRTYMFATIAKLLKNEDGATAIEYGLIAALIAVAAVTVMGTVGTNLSSTFNTVAGKL